MKKLPGARPEAKTELMAARLAAQPTALHTAMEGLSSAGSRKFEYSKALMILSEQHPELLYPHFQFLSQLLTSENKIIKWNAFRIIANLAPIDEEGHIGRIFDAYIAPITGPAMITAANAIQGAVKIATVEKQLTDKVIRAILKVEQTHYQTDECRNIVIGHAIKALGMMDEPIRRRENVVAFVRRQTHNSRNATRKKAEIFLKGL